MNKVKKVSCYKTTFSKTLNEELNEEREILFDREFDEEGRKTYDCHYEHGEKENIAVLEYNEQGLLQKEVIDFVSDELQETTEFKYDENKQIIQKIKHFPSSDCSTSTYLYNDKGLLIKKETKDSGDEVEEVETFEYKEDLLIKEVTRNWTGEETLTIDYTYDDQKRLVEEKRFHVGEVPLRTVYSYEKSNDKPDITISNLKTGKTVEAWRYFFDDKQRLTEEIVESIVHAHTKQRTAYSYDEDGHVVEILRYDFDKLVSKTTFKYEKGLVTEEISETPDAKGNFFKNSVVEYEYDLLVPVV